MKPAGSVQRRKADRSEKIAPASPQLPTLPENFQGTDRPDKPPTHPHTPEVPYPPDDLIDGPRRFDGRRTTGGEFDALDCGKRISHVRLW